MAGSTTRTGPDPIRRAAVDPASASGPRGRFLEAFRAARLDRYPGVDAVLAATSDRRGGPNLGLMFLDVAAEVRTACRPDDTEGARLVRLNVHASFLRELRAYRRMVGRVLP